MIYVNWHDAKDYTAWLSEQTGKRYRLPSESKWEYAARAGTETACSWYGLESLRPSVLVSATTTPGACPASSRRVAILRGRHELYDAARRQHPTRWSGDTRNWGHIREVWLNPKNDRALTTKVA